MPRPSKPIPGNRDLRFHYIPEWAEHRAFRQSDIARELGVDKSSVFRWFEGNLPAEKHLVALADLFNCEITSLFRHPDDDWLSAFFKSRTQEERDRLRALIDIAFPKLVA